MEGRDDMADSIKFNPQKLAKLNDPRRLEMINPDLIWEALELTAPRVLVDIGAGTGIFARNFAARVPAGTVYACDSSPVMADWMRENPAAANVVSLLSGESSVPLEGEIADLVYMITVHHELEEPELLLAETRRLLKPGGKVALVDWRKEAMPDGPPIEIRVAEEAVMEQLRNAGFRNVRRCDVLPRHFLVVGEK